MRNKISYILSDSHTREMLQGSALALFLKVLASGILLVFNVAVGRLFGAEGAGLFFLALSVTTVASVVARVGLDNALLRYVSALSTHGEWSKLASLYRLSMRIAIMTSSAVTLVMFLMAPFVASTLFNKPELAEPLRWMSLTILPFSLLNLHAECLKGMKRVRDSIFIQGIIVSLVSLIMIYPFSQMYGLMGAVWAYVLASGLGLCAAYWLWHKFHPSCEITDTFSFDLLMSSSKPLFAIAITGNAIMPFAPIFFLGIWGSSYDVGIFGAASRIAAIVGFILVTMNNIMAPKFSELFVNNDLIGLERLARRSSLVMIVITSPLFLFIIFNSQFVMGVFGEDFKSGGDILILLTLGQMANLMTGSVGYLLMMCGFEKNFRSLTISSVVLLLVLCFLLAPVWGSVGVAVAASLSLAAMNLASVYVVRKRLLISPVIWMPKLRGLTNE